jgi:hypothetical protein
MASSKKNIRIKNKILTDVAEDYIQYHENSTSKKSMKSDRNSVLLNSDQKYRLDELALLISTNLRNRNISKERVRVCNLIDFIVAKFFEDNKIDFKELFKDNIEMIISKYENE